MNDRAPTDRAITDAAAAVRSGRLVVLPTDTVYGIASLPSDPRGIGRLFEVKGRPRDRALPVLAASLEHARAIARFDARAERLASDWWPGGLTLVLERAERSRSWDLGGSGRPPTIAVRVPSHRLALLLLERTGPLAVTSANRSGERPAATEEALRAVFGASVAVYLVDERPLAGAPSTVLDLTRPHARILRAGALDARELARSLPDEGALLDSPLSP